MPFDLAQVEEGIAGSSFHSHLMHFPSVTSTNQLAVEAAQSGARTGVWIADEQTAGRGRGDHTWHSTAGDGLYVSILVTPQIPLERARNIPLAAGLAVQAAVVNCTGLVLDLKWPNDLMIGNKKCGGILVESASEPAPAEWQSNVGPALRYAVIGIGLNLNHSTFPRELSAIATSLFIESDRRFEREPLLTALLCNLDEEMTELRKSWLGTSNKPDLFRRFKGASTWVHGKRVRVDEQGGYTGVTRGLDPNGFLLVLDDEGKLRTVLSGGVRPA
jgi:BirA family transcriptional regulator, biotin operon repressor / biotin---[acetyl-CoA-carboxylase] ligase